MLCGPPPNIVIPREARNLLFSLLGQNLLKTLSIPDSALFLLTPSSPPSAQTPAPPARPPFSSWGRFSGPPTRGFRVLGVLKNTKRFGEHSEAAFLHKASSLGFGIAKPWGDSERYDFILDNGRGRLRVQIKATDSLRAHAHETRATYTSARAEPLIPPRRYISSSPTSSLSTSAYVLPVRACMPPPWSASIPTAKPNECAWKNTAKPGT
jgi:PD-(D/E)XK endonuclease